MPRVLDLYCGAGGVSEGYRQAGFDVLGVDINPQKNYPFSFLQMNALDFRDFDKFDLIHASPPCQAYTRANWRGREYPKLIEPTGELLIASDKPYIIENVKRSVLNNPTMLCGTMFGMNNGYVELRRHRFFETSFELPETPYENCGVFPAYSVFGNGGTIFYGGENLGLPVAMQKELMGTWWMTVKEMSQAIPPAYTRWIGEQFLQRREQ